jgi:uncharacterized protein YciI
MSCFAVIREAGPAWAGGDGIAAQPELSDHSAFMDGLANDGFVLCAGPLAGSERGRLRALLVVDAEDEAEIHARLAEDPWARAGRLVVSSIEPWTVFVGAGRLAPASMP